MTLSCTCSSLLISEAVLEHADVFADRMRLPEAGINLFKFNEHCSQDKYNFFYLHQKGPDSLDSFLVRLYASSVSTYDFFPEQSFRSEESRGESGTWISI